MTVGSLFSGIGGLDLGLERAGMVIKWQVEIDPFCRKILEKHWPEVKRHGDIKGLTGAELEPVELICGGFPCQPVSLAGRRKAQSDERWLWPDFIRVVRVLRPRFILVENTPGLASAGVEQDEDGEWIEARGLALGEVLGDLAASGYDAEWDCIPAAAFGANHLRYRVWIVAYAQEHGRRTRRAGRLDPSGEGEREQALQDADAHEIRRRGRARQQREGRRTEPADSYPRILTDADITGLQERQEQVMLEQLASAQRTAPNAYGKRFSSAGHRSGETAEGQVGKPQDQHGIATHADYDGEPLVWAAIARGERHAWTVEPGVVRMVHGIPNRVDRIRALGNAVIPQVAQWIGERIMEVAA